MSYKSILKSLLKSLLLSCKKYGVDFEEILKEISREETQWKKKQSCQEDGN